MYCLKNIQTHGHIIYGAIDPNSRTVTLLDIARKYALLMHSSWIPRRTIILNNEWLEMKQQKH